ncbi:MAG: hypothetical protein ACR2JU_16570 [Nocardioidaceae bacterium]
MSYDTVVWLPNALILTALLAAFAVWRWRSKGALVGMRWAGVALLPLALYAIGVYRLLWSVGLAFSRFFTGFVFRPTVWVGLALLLVAAVLIVAPSRLRGRRTSDSARPTRRAAAEDDMTEIDDILKKHGLA